MANDDGQPVAITGMGLTTALGLSADETWRAILAGRCGSGPVREMEQPLPNGCDGCQAPDLPTNYEPSLPREARYLRWTIQAALRDAGAHDARPADPSRCALMLGTTLHGMRAGGRFFRSENYAELRDFLAGDTLRLATADLGLGGGAATTCSACSSSLGSIALGVTLLQTRQADLVVAGGYDTVCEYVWGGFNALRLVTDGPLRPFTRGRRGMKLGEGYGIVVLERLSDAKRRGAGALAIVAGWGESADAHHLTQPHPQGEGAHRAMRAALDRAGIDASQLGLVAAHATGTPDNDAAEFAALTQLLGNKLTDVPVVCFKSHLGHTLGGAGAAELILSALAIRDGAIPACANLRPEEIEYPGLRVTTGQASRVDIRYTLNTSLGFGGANTCVVLASPRQNSGMGVSPMRSQEHERDAHVTGNARRSREVWVTGVGVLLPSMIGNEVFIARLRESTPTAWQVPPGAIQDVDFEHLLNARRVRRMSNYVKLTLAAATLACRDAGLAEQPDLLRDTSAFLGTTHGSSAFCVDYYAQIVREGLLAANPMLFAEGVPNVGAAQLSAMLGLKAVCQSIIGSRTAGLDALRLAWLRVCSGAIDRVIVSGGEESQATVNRAYDECGLRSSAGASCAPFAGTSGFCSTAGAVSLVIESSESARARGAIPYAKIDGAAAAWGDRDALPRTLAQLLSTLPVAPHALCSANGTWIDRVEMIALSRRAAHASVGSAYDACGEAFSASPLLAIAATLLAGELPSLREPPASADARFRWARRGEVVERFTSLCTDWNGGAASANLALMERSLQRR